jgi:ribosome-associated heat shock protein Hsp15
VFACCQVLYVIDLSPQACYVVVLRIDKYLWAARFFKTRSIAATACELGRIQSNGQLAKPARDVKIGDRLHIKTPGGDFEVEVLALSEMRGPASVAVTLYRETEESKEVRRKAAEDRKAFPHFEPPQTKPSKRDRRVLDRFRREYNPPDGS